MSTQGGREIELETQTKEKRRNPAPSQPTAKKFKIADTTNGGKRGSKCSKYGKAHEGACRVLIYYTCRKEGHYS